MLLACAVSVLPHFCEKLGGICSRRHSILPSLHDLDRLTPKLAQSVDLDLRYDVETLCYGSASEGSKTPDLRRSMVGIHGHSNQQEVLVSSRWEAHCLDWSSDLRLMAL